MKHIELTQGKKAIVDDEEFVVLSKHKWHAKEQKHTWYAASNIVIDGKRRTVYMHRLITGLNNLLITDHIDGNGLNNQKSNLRACNPSQSTTNTTGRGISKYKGVSFNKRYKKWRVVVSVNRKPVYEALFENENSAALAYNEKAIIHHGEFAKLNIISPA